MEITAAIRKKVKSLSSAKKRREYGLFIAEGTKCVLDTLPYFRCYMLAATSQWLEKYADRTAGVDVAVVTRADMERMSHMSEPPSVLAVYHIPSSAPVDITALSSQLTLALDCIQDPGNLGTIMRVADWMGVHTILASPDTADVYNPKTVQATMGSIARVRVHYLPLPDILRALARSAVPVYGTMLDRTARNIYTFTPQQNAVLVMGNEGRGLSPQVSACVTQKIYIPPYPADAQTAESLNVAVATSIALAQIRQHTYI